jgi:hypothetical protein
MATKKTGPIIASSGATVANDCFFSMSNFTKSDRTNDPIEEMGFSIRNRHRGKCFVGGSTRAKPIIALKLRRLAVRTEFCLAEKYSWPQLDQCFGEVGRHPNRAWGI